MRFSAKWLIYIAAALALVAGVAAYSISEHEHEESGLIEGDIVKVAVVGAALAVVAAVSFIYLAKKPPEGA